MELTQLGDLLQPGAWVTWVYVSARLVGLMLIAPVWRVLPAPAMARALMVIIWGACLVPGVQAAGALPLPELNIVPLATELALGVLLGTIPLILLGAAGLAGDAVGLQSGLTLGGALSPSMRELSAGWGEWFGWTALATFMVLRGDLLILEALAGSLQVLPPGHPWGVEGLEITIARLPLEVIRAGLQIASPIVVALFVANLGLGLLNRAIPQLNVMMAAFPITIASALIVGALGTPVFVRAFGAMTLEMPATWARLLELVTTAP